MNTSVNEITLGKDRYHLNSQMQAWCSEHIGPGEWLLGRPQCWDHMGDLMWSHHSMFGQTTYSFRQARDLTMFALRWA
jgi:hypothetical protein